MPTTKNVVLMERDLQIIRDQQESMGLGERGFSAALRLIIREWDENKAEAARIRQANQALDAISDWMRE